MSKRKTVLPGGETAASRKAAPVLRQRSKIKQMAKSEKPLKRHHPVVKKGSGRYGTAQYKPQYAGEAQRLAQMGKTQPQIAQYFGISVDTVKQWMKKHPDFARCIGYGKVDLMAEGVNCLQALIKGAQQIRVTKRKNKDTGKMQVVSETKIKHPPNIQAAQFYLTAVDPQKWALGNLKGESTMSMVASLGLLDTIMRRVPTVQRKALPPPSEQAVIIEDVAEFPPQTMGQVAAILDASMRDETRIVPD